MRILFLLTSLLLLWVDCASYFVLFQPILSLNLSLPPALYMTTIPLTPWPRKYLIHVIHPHLIESFTFVKHKETHQIYFYHIEKSILYNQSWNELKENHLYFFQHNNKSGIYHIRHVYQPFLPVYPMIIENFLYESPWIGRTYETCSILYQEQWSNKHCYWIHHHSSFSPSLLSKIDLYNYTLKPQYYPFAYDGFFYLPEYI